MNETPQQTSPVNCTVFALAWAIEEALRQAGPQYVQTVDRKALEALTGAPMMPNEMVWLINNLAPYNHYRFEKAEQKPLVYFPIVVAYSGDGFSHSLGVRSATDTSVEVYDPAYGTYRWIDREYFKLYSGDWILVGTVDPEVTKPWYKFAIVRFLARIFGLL